MKKILLLLPLLLFSCQKWAKERQAEAMQERSEPVPVPFLPELIPAGMIIHSGTFSPDQQEYYYTISGSGFKQFNVKMVGRSGNGWSEPQNAFFNTTYSEHGTQFSPDGKKVYFSSTRPTGIKGKPEIWHLWKSEKTDSGWSEPELIDIPNLRDMSVSHPTVTADGTLYFHASQPDYTEMTLYTSELNNGEYAAAQKLPITANSLACTPFVTANGDLLIYAAIGSSLDLMISTRAKDGNWNEPEKLGKTINSNGQGNPYLSPDRKYLYFTQGSPPQKGAQPDWQVLRVGTAGFLEK